MSRRLRTSPCSSLSQTSNASCGTSANTMSDRSMWFFAAGVRCAPGWIPTPMHTNLPDPFMLTRLPGIRRSVALLRAVFLLAIADLIAAPAPCFRAGIEHVFVAGKCTRDGNSERVHELGRSILSHRRSVQLNKGRVQDARGKNRIRKGARCRSRDGDPHLPSPVLAVRLFRSPLRRVLRKIARSSFLADSSRAHEHVVTRAVASGRTWDEEAGERGRAPAASGAQGQIGPKGRARATHGRAARREGGTRPGAQPQ